MQNNLPNALVWLRLDLRIEDNPALEAALQNGYNPIMVYIHDPQGEGMFSMGSASLSWLHHALSDLDSRLRSHRSQLIFRQGNSLEQLENLIHSTKAQAIFWNRRYEPPVIARDKEIKKRIQDLGLEVESFGGNLLFEPHKIFNAQNNPYRVFTPFSKVCFSHEVPSPHTSKLRFSQIDTPSQTWNFLPEIPWDKGFWKRFEPTREAGLRRLVDMQKKAGNYSTNRDFPALSATSELSPYLHFGQISPREAWHHLATTKSSLPWLRQLLWREFSWHLLYHYPHTAVQPLNSSFEKFPFLESPEELKAWQQGKTGYPLIDAGMRELWQTGTMHNRVRMAVGSFLVKHLLIDWKEGFDWFWDTLLDADAGNNVMGWQWIAGCGADAAPYFRIFNPVLQGEKFDPDGIYVKTYLPELKNLPSRWIHRPFEAPPMVLKEAGISLGRTYPRPIIDHKFARKRALEALKTLKR